MDSNALPFGGIDPKQLILVLNSMNAQIKSLSNEVKTLKKENRELKAKVTFATMVAKTSSPCFSDLDRANAIDKVCELLGERANIEHVNYTAK